MLTRTLLQQNWNLKRKKLCKGRKEHKNLKNELF